MCIYPSPDPTEPGVWWQDDHQWRQYDKEMSEKIRMAKLEWSKQLCESTLDLGVIKSTAHPKGVRYSLDLEKMEQKNPNTGMKRPVQIIDEKLESTEKKSQPDALSEVQYKDSHLDIIIYRREDGEWVAYSPKTAADILKAAAAGEKGAYVTDETTNKLRQAFVNVLFMREEIWYSKKTKDIRMEVVLKPPKAVPKSQRERLIGAIEQFRSGEFLDKALPMKMSTLSVDRKRHNPHLKTGSPQYERFLAAAEDLGLLGNPTDSEDGDAGRPFGQLLPAADATYPAVELVFHDTAASNIDPILMDGMDPKLRQADGDCFGRTAESILGYSTANPKKLLAFLVLQTKGISGNVIVIKQVEYELPVAEVTLSPKNSPTRQKCGPGSFMWCAKGFPRVEEKWQRP